MAYCTLQQARMQMQTDQTIDNGLVADLLLDATQAIDDYTGYTFEEQVATYGFNGEVNSPRLNLDDRPLVAVTTLTNGDGTVITSGNYSLLPISGYPKFELRLAVGTYWLPPNAICNPPWPYQWPLIDYAYAEDAIQIAGIWSWNRRGPLAWKNSGLTVSGAVLATASALPLSAQADFAFDVGSVLKVVIASGAAEYLYVNGSAANVAASTPDGLTTSAPDVERGWNGSTALAFVGGEVIYVYQPERTVAWACRETVAASYKSRDNASGRTYNPNGFGSVSIVDLPEKVRTKLVWPYHSFVRGQG